MFRLYIGPGGVFFASISFMFLEFLFLFFELLQNLSNGSFLFLDFGFFVTIYDILDTSLVFICDTLSILTALLVILLSIFAQFFGIEYMYREGFIIRLQFLLNFFSTSVVFLFVVYDLFLFLIV